MHGYLRLGPGLLAVVAGCASTSVTTMKAPEIAPAGYRRIMVAFPVADLRLQKLVEDAFSSEDGSFVSSYPNLFPGQPYTSDDLRKVIASQHLDAILVLSVDAAGTKSSTLPSTTQCTVYGSSGCTTAVTTGGGDLSKPWANFRAQLFDVSQGKIVWVATEQAKGNAYAKVDDLLRSMSGETINKLRTDGVVRPP